MTKTFDSMLEMLADCDRDLLKRIEQKRTEESQRHAKLVEAARAVVDARQCKAYAQAHDLIALRELLEEEDE